MRRQALIIVACLICLRLPFLFQAIQGDDYYYLAAAEHAQIDPLHPHHARYVFLGIPMDMRGHPHPPGNAWLLAGMLTLTGDVKELPFHLGYLLLSLVAGLSMLALARRLLPERALEATLLYCAVPAFVVNGNSLESDLPLLAFWTLSVALVVWERPAWLVALALAATALMAYQSVVLVPVLALYFWQQGQLRRRLWLLAVPLAVLAGYQLFEKLSAGSVPAAVLNQHFSTYGLQSATRKLRSAVALCGHLAVMCSPLGLWALLRERQRFLGAWLWLFFAAALMLFFAGSARYLLPLAAPGALLVAAHYARQPRLIWTCIGLQLLVGLSLAWVNFQHWDGYRHFAAESMAECAGRRVWVDGEWGLRYYAEAAGALPVERGQMLRAGDVVLSSELSGGVPYTTGGGQLVRQARMELRPTLPLRLIGRGSGSAYSSADFGLWPFGWSREPVDVLTRWLIVERAPELSWLPMNVPQAEWQIVSGVYGLEGGTWRWADARSAYLLKAPAGAAALAAEINIPAMAPGRTVTLLLDGVPVAQQTFAAPGGYRIESQPVAVKGPSPTLGIVIDGQFQAPGDDRKLGLIVSAAGFVQPR